jgi:hypothetical protein
MILMKISFTGSGKHSAAGTSSLNIIFLGRFQWRLCQSAYLGMIVKTVVFQSLLGERKHHPPTQLSVWKRFCYCCLAPPTP